MVYFHSNKKVMKSSIFKRNKNYLPLLEKIPHINSQMQTVGPVKLSLKEFGYYPIRDDKFDNLRFIDEKKEEKIAHDKGNK